MPRVTISELLVIAKAVKRYFEELVSIAEPVFGVFSNLLDSFGLPPDVEIERDLTRMREYRKTHPDRPIMFSALQR